MPAPVFADPADARSRLAGAGYLADAATATTVYLAGALERALLVEGPAGVGKTELAKAVAQCTDAELIRLQCYEGLDEARALYEWNYKKQLLRIQASAAGDSGRAWEQTHDDIFTEEFLLTRPLLGAIRRSGPTVLLIDEIDKTDVEVEALLLEVLSDFQVTIPELGTIAATRRPFVVLTSNANRELSEALKRRCLYLYLDYPSPERERDILLERVPGLERSLAEQVARVAATLRTLDLRKSPSLAESIDWARTLLALGIDNLDGPAVASTLGVVLKHVADHNRAVKELDLPAARRMSLVDRHHEFVVALRGAGLAVSVDEDIVAATALGAVDLLDREQLRAAYAAAIVKRQTDRPAFDTLFDLHFPAVLGNVEPEPSADPDHATSTFRRDDPDLLAFRAALAEALRDGDEQRMTQLAREGVGRFGAVAGRLPGTQSWSGYAAQTRISPQTLMAGLLEQVLYGSDDDRLAERNARTMLGARIDRFRAMLDTEVQRRLAAESGRERIAKQRRASERRPGRSAERHPRRPGCDPPRDPTAGAQAGGAAGHRAPARPPGPARLPPHHPGLAVVRWHAGRDAPPPASSAQDRSRDPVRRERVGHVLRPLHPAACVRAARAVQPGARVRLRRRPRRGHRTSSVRATISSNR